MRHGFVTVAAAVPSVRVADTDFNLRAIECQIARAEGMGKIVCYGKPEQVTVAEDGLARVKVK